MARKPESHNPADLRDPKPGEIAGMPTRCELCGGRHPGLGGRCGYCIARLAAQAARVNCVIDPPGIREVRMLGGHQS